eukprot:g5073.t1
MHQRHLTSKFPFVDDGNVADLFAGDGDSNIQSLIGEPPVPRAYKQKSLDVQTFNKVTSQAQASENDSNCRNLMMKKSLLLRKRTNSAAVQELLEEVQDGVAVRQGLHSFRRAFLKIDSNRSGSIDTREVAKLLTLLNLDSSPAAARALVARCDLNNNGSISYSELAFALSGERGGGTWKTEYTAAYRKRPSPPTSPKHRRGYRGNQSTPPPPAPFAVVKSEKMKELSLDEGVEWGDLSQEKRKELEDYVPVYVEKRAAGLSAAEKRKIGTRTRRHVRPPGEGMKKKKKKNVSVPLQIEKEVRSHNSKDSIMTAIPSTRMQCSVLLGIMNEMLLAKARKIFHRLVTPIQFPAVCAAMQTMLPRERILQEDVTKVLQKLGIELHENISFSFENFCGIFLCIERITKDRGESELRKKKYNLNSSGQKRNVKILGKETDDYGVYINAETASAICNDVLGSKQLDSLRRSFSSAIRDSCANSDNSSLETSTIAAACKAIRRFTRRPCKVDHLYDFLSKRRLALLPQPEEDAVPVGKKEKGVHRLNFISFVRATRHFSRSDTNGRSQSLDKITHWSKRKVDKVKSKSKTKSVVKKRLVQRSKALKVAKEEEKRRIEAILANREIGETFTDSDGSLRLHKGGGVLDTVETLLEKSSNILKTFGSPEPEIEIRMPKKKKKQTKYWIGEYDTNKTKEEKEEQKDEWEVVEGKNGVAWTL